jgi:hypothetical protein
MVISAPMRSTSACGASTARQAEVYARSIDKLGPLYHGIDATAGVISFSDGTVHHLAISWALR